MGSFVTFSGKSLFFAVAQTFTLIEKQPLGFPRFGIIFTSIYRPFFGINTASMAIGVTKQSHGASGQVSSRTIIT